MPIWPSIGRLMLMVQFQQVLRDAGLAADNVRGIGVTGQMHGLVMLDSCGEVLRPAILWNDQRSAPQCADIVASAGGLEGLLALTANAVVPGFTSPKILWVRENEPHTYERTAAILLPKDYVRFRLSSELGTDVSDASGTGIFDVAKRRWSSEMLSLLHLPVEWMPAALESPTVAGKVSRACGETTGLRAGTPIVAGAGDQAAQAVGTGAISEDVVSVTCGTSGVVFVSANSCPPNPGGILHVFCHALPERWHIMGVMLAAGGSLRWYRDTLAGEEVALAKRHGEKAYDLFSSLAARAPAGSDGLLFLPYLDGERTPHPDAAARAAYVGLTSAHVKRHLTRAVMEGVAFGLNDMLGLLRDVGTPIAQVRLTGGGARSAVWRQIMADVFGVKIARVSVTEGAACGAALLAGVGAGVFASTEEAVAQAIRVTDTTLPVEENDSLYRGRYRAFRSLYPALKPVFDSYGATG